MVAFVENRIGYGMYTVAEAAMYARVSTSMMTRWLFGGANSEATIEPQFGRSEKLVSFLDLVQTLAVREIRLQRKVSLQKIRLAIRTAREHYGVDYPFAMQHTTFLFGEDVVILRPGTEDEFVQVTGRHKDQRLFSFVEMYLEDLSYSALGVASAYQIYKSRHQKPVPVVMNPEVRFGEPLLPSGYTAIRIWEAIKSEGGIERAAKAYDLPIEEVQAAYQFYDHLNHSAA